MNFPVFVVLERGSWFSGDIDHKTGQILSWKFSTDRTDATQMLQLKHAQHVKDSMLTEGLAFDEKGISIEYGWIETMGRDKPLSVFAPGKKNEA